ncbi:hypothetical protein GMST_38610 [Geomonas silvestris]|uniref:Uncharacterized protein n=1 Tax=Geomonas silvestris TaxID=2740184 RepID=A0A6V8MNB8_9BACT|nr:DNA-binding protein [Geomonas silvestris]GFO61536.1 hypothetical protein GMST_38610 [Geomonas silvestris]
MTVGNEAFYSLAEVARQLGTTETRILMLLKQGALEGELVDGCWFIYQSSVAGLGPDRVSAPLEPSCRTSCSASTCACHYSGS